MLFFYYTIQLFIKKYSNTKKGFIFLVLKIFLNKQKHIYFLA